MIIAYEVKLNSIHNKYPDFLLMFKGVGLRVEIKDKENEQTIAKEINSLSNFKEKEFWYVVGDHINIDKINTYATKKDKRIKVMYANQILIDKIQKFFGLS